MSLFLRRVIVLVAGAVGGLLAWPFAELLLGVQYAFPSYLVFMIAAGAVYGTFFGLSFGSVDGITGGVAARKWIGLGTGAAAGLVGGAFGALVGQGIYLALGQYLLQRPDARFAGFVVARGIGWATMGVFIGGVEGLRLRSGKRAGIGALGGFVGGLLGGLLLEYGTHAFADAWWIRPAGSVVLGLLVGAGFATIERGFLFGRLALLTGSLRGREYPLPPGRTTIGGAVGDTITVANYTEVSPKHAVVVADRAGMRIARGRGELRVNEEPVEQAELKYDDVIDVGTARFYLKRP